MARLVFCVDHLFQQAEDGTVYTTGGKFPYAKWEEYLAFFDEILVVARGRPLAGHANLARSSGPGIRFRLMDSHRGVRRLVTLGEQRAAIDAALPGADAVIGRIPGEIGLAGCNAATKAGLPCLVEVVACPWDALWNHGSPAAKAYAPLMVHRIRSLLRRASLVHYVTREFLQRRYPTPAPFICASNVMLPEPEPGLIERRIERLKAWRSGERPLVFGTIGALFTRLKGIDLAIEALAGTKAGAHEYRVLGEGDPARLSAAAARFGNSNAVHFDGVLPGAAEVARWLDGIDVYLQPSYQEGLPRAMIEAMNRGCLAIGSTVGGIPELVPAERMHAPGDAAALRARIEALLACPDDMLEQETRRNFEVAQRYSYVRSLAEKRRAYRALRDWADHGGPPVLPDAAAVAMTGNRQ